MKPEMILQSEFLDILFDNRNKAYGAYTLRKEYATRLGKALSVTGLIVVALALLSFYNNKNNNDQMAGPVIMVDSVFLEPPPEKAKEPEQVQKKYDEPVREKQYATPIITKNELVTENLPTIDDLNKAIIGNEDKDGRDAGSDDLLPPGDADNFSTKPNQDPVVVAEPIETGPLYTADVMPEFPGGHDAFMRFMLRNLRQPDLEQGQKIVVRIQFVVDVDGTINNVVILQSGGELDNEVLRVVHKMPNWKPGLQAGKFVPVYFQLPVTFVAGE
jgi:periplasmic protein TonB